VAPAGRHGQVLREAWVSLAERGLVALRAFRTAGAAGTARAVPSPVPALMAESSLAGIGCRFRRMPVDYYWKGQ
jgi:hypothetical protein